MEFQQREPKNNTIPHEIPVKLWKTIGTDICTQIISYLFENLNEFPVVK